MKQLRAYLHPEEKVGVENDFIVRLVVVVVILVLVVVHISTYER